MDLNVLEKEQREQKGQKRSFHCTLASYNYQSLSILEGTWEPRSFSVSGFLSTFVTSAAQLPTWARKPRSWTKRGKYMRFQIRWAFGDFCEIHKHLYFQGRSLPFFIVVQYT